MSMRRTLSVLIVVLTFAVPELLACGDKFLLTGHFGRYQRPKNARAAAVLIYANPATGLPAALNKVPLEAVLRREGHTFAAGNSVEAVQKMLGSGLDAPVVVPLCVKSSGPEPAGAKNARCVKMPPKE